MKSVSEIEQKHSERVFWVIQTIFGLIIGRSFYIYGSAFLPPVESDIITLSLALVTVYGCVLWSWVDFSFVLIASPYSFKRKPLERYRFASDLFIVLIYTYLLLFIGIIQKDPDSDISGFIYSFSIVYLGYALSGILRIIEYGPRASKIILISIFFVLFLFLSICYDCLPNELYSVEINRLFIFISFCLNGAYRIVRANIGKRKYIIGVDVDGVLSNQIVDIIPIVKNKLGIEISYDDVTDWRLELKNTSIDKLIISEQGKKGYIDTMPTHPNASSVTKILKKKYKIAIATARPSITDKWTKEWLKKNHISYDTYHNLKEGEKHNAEEDFDILIDDYIGNIASFLNSHRDKRAILFSQPWNQDRDTIESYIQERRIEIVNGWVDVPEAIMKLLEN